MPLDFTMLLGTSPPAATFVPFEVVPSPFDDCAGLMDGEPPFACRRVATFPMVNRHLHKPSSLKHRSSSESTDLHKLTSYGNGDAFSLADFKRELHLLLEEDQQDHGVKEKDNGSAGPSSPTESDDEIEQQERRAKKSRKKVVFADDRGMQLAVIRVMTEPSDVPPKINPAVIRALLGDQWTDDDDDCKACATWIINFKQPASEYIAFRQKLDTAFISVENVLVKNDQCRLIGTVKVKNLSFEKEVFVRTSDNEWKSYIDRSCKYLTNRCGGDCFDTFQFDFEIPRDDATRQRLEFCVCYRTSAGQEYWDSNGGNNYEIISESLRLQRSQSQPSATTNGHANDAKHGRNGFYRPAVDALTLNCSNWTEFASWSDLSTQGPYW